MMMIISEKEEEQGSKICKTEWQSSENNKKQPGLNYKEESC
jgi:hypothetical protein